MSEQKKTLGQVLYEANRRSVGFSLPWDQIPGCQYAEWEQLADAVAAEVRKEWEEEKKELQRLLEQQCSITGEYFSEIERLRKLVHAIQPVFKFKVGQTVIRVDIDSQMQFGIIGRRDLNSKYEASYFLFGGYVPESELISEDEVVQWIKAKGVKAQ